MRPITNREFVGSDEGFTLIELLVVIIIIGILAAIAIPVFLNQRQKGYDAQTKSDLRNAAESEESYLTSNFVYTTSIGALAAQGWKQSTNDTALTVVSIHNDPHNDADGGYCLKAVSASGKTFYYDSNAGTGIVVSPCT